MLTLAVLMAAAVAVQSCHSVDSYSDTAAGNFELLWKLFDEHYCFFAEKGVDWDDVHDRYAPRARECRTQLELFRLCSAMLDELKDGHVNLSAPFATSYYKGWWAPYAPNYNRRVVQENYLNFQYRSLGAVEYGILPQNVGYVNIQSFASGMGEGNLDWILSDFALCSGLIIDVRDNGGGSMDNVEPWVSRFLKTRTLAGYICHKDGPGHNDFSKPHAYYYAPPADHILWTKPVVVLANRSTFSAANNFVSVMKLIPGVTVIGDVTGGGSGMPLSFELPVGWGVRMSAAPVLDAQGQATEFGVEPTDGYKINITPEDTAAGRDPILDAAIRLLAGSVGVPV